MKRIEPDQAHAPMTAAENGERSPAAAVNALPWPIATGCLLQGTRTRQAQSMLWVGDSVQVVMLLLFLWRASSWWRS